MTEHGPKWITLQVNKGPLNRLIKDIFIEDGDWKEKQLNLIARSYEKTPGFKQYFPAVEKLYNRDISNLMEFNLGFIRWGCEILNIKTNEIFSSSYDIHKKGSERLTELVKRVKGTHYLTGSGSKNYLKNEYFKERDIKVVWQNFEHPKYQQRTNKFVGNLSFLDLLMFTGSRAREIFNGIPAIKL